MHPILHSPVMMPTRSEQICSRGPAVPSSKNFIQVSYRFYFSNCNRRLVNGNSVELSLLGHVHTPLGVLEVRTLQLPSVTCATSYRPPIHHPRICWLLTTYSTKRPLQLTGYRDGDSLCCYRLPSY